MARAKHLYQLPRPLLCDPDKPVTMQLVKEYIDKHRTQLRRYDYLEGLFLGYHDIYRQPDKEAWKPDNRLAVNFPKYITNISFGYGYGIPIQKHFPDDQVDEAVKEFEKRNHIVDHEGRLFKACFKFGHAWEYFYQNERAETRMKVLSPKQFFCVYDDTMEERSLFAVRYGYRIDGTIYGEVSTREWQRNFVKSDWDGEERVNPYGLIPAVEYMLNDERMGLYEDVADMIEAYNHTISEKSNDVDAFAESYLAILGAKVDEDGVRRIRDDRVINIYGTSNADDIKNIIVQFLSKPTADTTQENLLNRLERLIFQISMAANISDESFNNAASGEAMAYKLLATGTMLSTFDTKIEKSLQKRYKIFCSLSTNVANPEAWREAEVKFNRNLPKNTKQEIENARNAEGIVSQRTQLSLMPSVVQDPDTELEQIARETEETQESIVDRRMFGIGAGNGTEQSGVLETERSSAEG